GDDQKIAKDWDKEHKSSKTNALQLTLTIQLFREVRIGTIEHGILTSVLQKKRN
ncbi:4334_t:CDS:1, partial [Racocetra fulgida]